MSKNNLESLKNFIYKKHFPSEMFLGYYIAYYELLMLLVYGLQLQEQEPLACEFLVQE